MKAQLQTYIPRPPEIQAVEITYDNYREVAELFGAEIVRVEEPVTPPSEGYRIWRKVVLVLDSGMGRVSEPPVTAECILYKEFQEHHRTVIFRNEKGEVKAGSHRWFHRTYSRI